MRDILFKAKRKNWKELPKEQWWVKGYLLKSFTGISYIVVEYDHIIGTLEIYEVISETICQYTGLTDMNGQKIWENDILCGQLDDMCPDDKTYAQVLWYKNGWYTKENDGIDYNMMDEFDEHFFAVVGNVFDNADLLKEVV